MSRYDVLLTLDDFEKDDNPEVSIAYCTPVKNEEAKEKGLVVYRIEAGNYVVSTQANGIYNEFGSLADANADGTLGDQQDLQILCALANAFMRLNLDKPDPEPD